MKQTILVDFREMVNGTIEFEITPEIARKVLEEAKQEYEIKYPERYFRKNDSLTISRTEFCPNNFCAYDKDQDNICPCEHYTEQQAKEYFDKRDARRAAEHRIKKAIEKMNGDKERDNEMCYVLGENTLMLTRVLTIGDKVATRKELMFNYTIGDYMLEHHTEDYKIYFGIE